LVGVFGQNGKTFIFGQTFMANKEVNTEYRTGAIYHLTEEPAFKNERQLNRALRAELADKERKINIWRVISGLSSLLAIIGIVYYASIGISWLIHHIFGNGQGTVSTVQQASGFSAGNVSTNSSGPVSSNENIIVIPNPLPGAAQAGSPAAAGSENSGQINNPGCPDYLGDIFACVQ
jgi:hypothetical protein